MIFTNMLRKRRDENNGSAARIGPYESGCYVAWLLPWGNLSSPVRISVPYVGCEIRGPGNRKRYVWSDALSDIPYDGDGEFAYKSLMFHSSRPDAITETILTMSLQEKIQRMYPHIDAIASALPRRLR